MEEVIINGYKYHVIKNYRNALVVDELTLKITDYFDDYDYIFGDYAYGKVRLKGFNDKSNKNFNEINDFSKIDDYIKNNCAYDCRYFILKRIEKVNNV